MLESPMNHSKTPPWTDFGSKEGRIADNQAIAGSAEESATGRPGPSNLEERTTAGSMGPKEHAHSSGRRRQKFSLSRSEARTGLRKLQTYVGILLLLSAATGTYLLATDGSLWILAISHAVGLIIIVLLDLALGTLSLFGVKRTYVASLAAAILGIALQLGDIPTAQQYNMTISYFASYLFGLVAFDLLLALQAATIIVGLLGRGYAQFFTRRSTREGHELNYSRRSFTKVILGLATLVGVGVLLGSIKVPASVSSSISQSGGGASGGPIAKASNLQPNSPVYFEYPQGYPNILLKRSDGSLVAFSLLCTHVCCQCSYEASSNVIYCPCHGSVFDTMGGRVLRGPAGYPLPSVTLNVDSSGNITAKGIAGVSPCMQG